ncbi:hypothetical protein KGM_200839 [Danaus plexippus plexippus]|uniref:Uncharacterized protein n=1 Tax=Danaus plexippus plexippus TaxID=278856 RepID=A0A212EV76_DANPL|nr:hypothetical protein KGM_200839 [Danaus plexippus plexippus]
MSPETQRLLPPTSETIMTKPFPIRVTIVSVYGEMKAMTSKAQSTRCI